MGQPYKQTSKHTHGGVYRVAPELIKVQTISFLQISIIFIFYFILLVLIAKLQWCDDLKLYKQVRGTDRCVYEETVMQRDWE